MKTLRQSKTAELPCIWMQAGVVKTKGCNHYFDCTTCKYDQAMSKAAASGRHATWQDALRCLDSRDRTCRHTLTGRAAQRTCPMNYNCNRCDFDQTFEDTLSPAAVHLTWETTRIKGFELPKDHFFHAGHTWARMEPGGFIRVGMDDFAMKVLGAPDHLELPLLGQELNQGQPGWGLRRKDNLAKVCAPVNGVITGVNPNPCRDPETVSSDPYSKGWLFTLHHSNPKKALAPLMDDETSPGWLDGEITGLEQMIEAVTGPMATDGGLIQTDVFGNLPRLGWHNLVRRFLGT